MSGAISTRRARIARRALAACAVVAGCALGFGERPTQAQLGPNLARASDAITAMDFDEAHRELDGADANDPNVALQAARLALYETRFDDAATILARPDVARTEAGEQFGDIARGCARVIAATVVDRDEARGIEVRYQDEGDRALTPVLVETIEKARAALERDLGVSWPRPMRVVIVRDLLSLAAVTGLPYDSAKTTGTVAVAKWGRVTLLSPRASRHGYAWRDTIAHELTHLAVTRLTVDRAPLWLQEGIAKREEIRWRPPGPFDDRPAPEAIVAHGAAQHLDTPLDKLGPSIAMLPSADRAAVAFAEVTSFVRFYADTVGPTALPSLLAAIRVRESASTALKELSGLDLAGWDAKWRAYLAARPVEPLPAAWALGAAPVGMREIRERARLAELLFGRGHPADALTELEPVNAEAWQDASLRHLRGLAFEASGNGAVVEASLGEPKDVASSYGPWWAIRARFARVRRDGAGADGFFLGGGRAGSARHRVGLRNAGRGLVSGVPARARALRSSASSGGAGDRQGLKPPFGRRGRRALALTGRERGG